MAYGDDELTQREIDRRANERLLADLEAAFPGE